MSDRRDVTGVWYGRWTSTDPRVRPNSFIATLSEANTRIAGSTSERDLYGRGIVGADVDGARSGGQLEFVKTYNSERLAHSVRYSGMINSAGTEITGHWHLPHHSGPFSMTREIFDDLDIEEGVTIGNPEEVTVR